MCRIVRLRIQGFKSFKDFELDLHSRNVIIGINGGGKSNLLSVFKLLRHIRNGHLHSYVGIVGGADRLLYMGSNVTRNLKIEITYSNFIYSIELAYTQRNSLVIVKETVMIDGVSHGIVQWV